MNPNARHLPAAGSLIAASWFAWCGHEVSWPLEPCRYDLLVRADGNVERIQVKTTTVRQGSSWTAWISTTRPKTRAPYDPDDIDFFFIIDGDLAHYLIPARRVGGLHAIALAAYDDCRIRPGSLSLADG